LLPSLSSQIATLEARIRKEDPLGSSTVKSVSAETLAQHQSLELDRQSAEKEYTEALALRTQAYLTAQNQQSYLALFVVPTLPQTSVYPDRTRAIAAVVLSAALAWFVGVMIIYALRDHLM
jgi:capsular polysaccharide transport system permease protein